MIEIPGYRIVEPIGRGSTASVYRAVQLSLEREVAIKVLHPELAADARAAARFLDEARLLAGLGHPQVVQVWDVGVSPDRLHYFSMRFLSGGDLASRIAAGPMPPDAVARVLFGVAKALEHIHGRGLVHRDVSPGNILFDVADAPYLTDFGVARSLLGVQDAALADLAPAAVHHASPEQLSGARIDHRADLYGLGVLAFECLTGRAPFVGEDPFEIAYAHVFEPPPQLPASLVRWQPLVDQALAKLPEARMPGAAAFAAMVERAAPDHISGLHQVVRAPHLEHIQTWRPKDEPSPPPVDDRPFSDDLATQISARPGAAAAVSVPVPRPGPPKRLAWLAAGAVVLLVLVAALAWILRPTTDAQDRVPQRAVAASEPPVPRETRDDAEARSSEAVVLDLEGSAQSDEAIYATPALDDLPTVVDPVEALTREGRRLLAAGRLMLPPGDNAHERFRAALVIDPGAERAMEGLADVGRAYLDLAAEADQLEERLGFWARGLEATAGVASAWPVEQAIRNARDAERDSHLARARLALERWEGDVAREAVQLALTIDPDATGAQQMLALADRVGRPGFVFSDPMGSGGQGPELVVVGGFALGLAPVTIAEFRRFRRANATELEAQRVGCRDRESGWRSSRRRTWEDPGFAQSDLHPVVCVTPADAEAFAAWLSIETGRRYRLPSEAEWRESYSGPAACAAANRGDTRFREAYGGRDGWDCDDGHAATSPVRSFAAVGSGLYDMDGNVREWSADCVDGTRGGCRERKALGSAWLSLDESEPAVRALNGDVAWNSVGFRILREL